MEELRTRILRLRNASTSEISTDDIRTAVRKLRTLGTGFAMYEVGSKTMVMSVPQELNRDHTDALDVAQREGKVTPSALRAEHGSELNALAGVMARNAQLEAEQLASRTALLVARSS